VPLGAQGNDGGKDGVERLNDACTGKTLSDFFCR
jgi:hypothetical protein